MYVLIPLLLVEVFSYVWSPLRKSTTTTLTSAVAVPDYSVLDTARDGALRRSRAAVTTTKSSHTNRCWNSHCNVIDAGCQDLFDHVQWRTCLAVLHDLQDRWYGHPTSVDSLGVPANTRLTALIACTTLHWITTPETADGDENGPAQALGVGFDESNDKESATIVGNSQSTTSQQAVSTTPCLGLKEVV